MTNILVCIKRVPDTAGSISLTADAQSVDASQLGHTVSPHEDCAIELAVQTAQATDGTATVLALGSDDSIEQLRDALALGCADAIHIDRNLYFFLRVKENLTRSDDGDTRYRSLVHGAILHGEQYLSDKYRRSATTYYKTSSGIGRALLAFEGRAIRAEPL